MAVQPFSGIKEVVKSKLPFILGCSVFQEEARVQQGGRGGDRDRGGPGGQRGSGGHQQHQGVTGNYTERATMNVSEQMSSKHRDTK